jgi:hypothetical protein
MCSITRADLDRALSERSELASGDWFVFGIATRTTCISENAAVSRIRGHAIRRQLRLVTFSQRCCAEPASQGDPPGAYRSLPRPVARALKAGTTFARLLPATGLVHEAYRAASGRTFAKPRRAVSTTKHATKRRASIGDSIMFSKRNAKMGGFPPPAPRGRRSCSARVFARTRNDRGMFECASRVAGMTGRLVFALGSRPAVASLARATGYYVQRAAFERRHAITYASSRPCGPDCRCSCGARRYRCPGRTGGRTGWWC